jgi:hypothetical protein
MAFNRYTQITPANYDARSLQDTLYLPTLKRQQHDQLDTKAAISKSQLDKFDSLDYMSDMTGQEKDRLNSQMDEFTSDLASQGVNNSSKSKFLDIGSEFSKATSESGMLYKADKIRKKFLADKENAIANATAAGYDPEKSLQNIDNVYKEIAENADPNKLEFIDVPQAPEYYDVASFLNDFKGDVGFTEYNKLINKGVEMDANGQIVHTGDDRLTKSNELQLEQLNKLATTMLLDPGSKGMATANWNGKPMEQLQAEVNAAIKMKKKISVITDFNKPRHTSGSRGKSSSSSSDDREETISNTNKSVSLGLENKQTLMDRIGTLKAKKQEALDSNNQIDIEKASVELRDYENINYEAEQLGQDVFNNVAGKPAEDFSKKLNTFYKTLVGFKPGDKEFNTGGEERIKKTVGLVESYLASEAQSTDPNQKNPTNFYDIDYNEDEETYTLSKKIRTREGGITNTEIESVILPKNVGESLKNLKPIFDEGTKAKEAAQDKFVTQYTKTRTSVTPVYEKSADKTNLEPDALKAIDSRAYPPSEAVIRDVNGEAIEDSQTSKDLNSPKAMENLFNYATKNPNNFKINRMSVSSMGNQHGYLISLTPKNDVVLNDSWKNTKVPEGGTVEFFVEFDKKDLGGGDGIGFFFRKALTTEDKSDLKRRMKYDNFTATSNPANLGKDYDLPSLSFTGEINQDQTIDFLKKGNDISIEKVSKENPGKSQGSLTWTELFEGIKDNVSPDDPTKLPRSVSQLYDMAFRRLDENQLNAFENLVKKGKDTKNFLKEALKDKKVILKANSSDLEIILGATQQ